jgi:hypothetical protein
MPLVDVHPDDRRLRLSIEEPVEEVEAHDEEEESVAETPEAFPARRWEGKMALEEVEKLVEDQSDEEQKPHGDTQGSDTVERSGQVENIAPAHVDQDAQGIEKEPSPQEASDLAGEMEVPDDPQVDKPMNGAEKEQEQRGKKD